MLYISELILDFSIAVMPQLKLYPEIYPYFTGTLKVSDLHTIFYEEVGNPNGKPALFLHGGPGVGIFPDYRRFFDPDIYRIILPDQRGAGRSTPHAEIKENTTWNLVEDLEKLRSCLGIEKWVVMGGSWGSTLALSYAITYPGSVAGLILRAVYLARPSEITWLHQQGGASNFFPDEWERYLVPIPVEERNDTVKAYHQLLNGDDKNARIKAARAWARWEASIMTLIPDDKAVQDMENDRAAISIGQIECHYTLHNFFMKSDNFLLENINKIRHIPCHIVQGRHDVISPMNSAWDLHKALPNSELRIVPNGSHSPMEIPMANELVSATKKFVSV